MGIIDSSRKQTAVYWALDTTTFDQYGDPVYIAGVELRVRWEDVAMEFVDANGTTHISSSLVYTGEDVDVGGVLMLGERCRVGGAPR